MTAKRRSACGIASIAAMVAIASPAAADRTTAAEHFADAQAAERRGQWQTAIEHYELAYELEPHPAVLFNIANGYEELGDYRAAARYFLRYLDDSPQAEDRDSVQDRVRALRARRSTVSFTCRQAGAEIYVDDVRRGTAPLDVELAAGHHRAWAVRDGARSPVRTIQLEYGDPLAIALDMTAAPGRLRIESNLAGAEIRVDGQVVGTTPFEGEVVPGKHVVAVEMLGYGAVHRVVVVPESGDEKLYVMLDADARAPQPSPQQTGKLIIGTGYGYSASDSAGFRFQAALGYRLPNNWLELSALAGAFGGDIGAGVGAEARVFVSRGLFRPYVRAGGLVGVRAIGNAMDGTDEPERGVGLEGGVGLLYAGFSRGNAAYEWFVEADGQYVLGADEPLRVPLLLGIAVRVGAGD